MADKFHSGIKIGSTSVIGSFVLRSSTDSTEVTGKLATDMNISYQRQGAARVAVTEIDAALVTSVWASGNVKEIDATNMPGSYRLDYPDAMFVSGADWVELNVKVSGCFIYKERFSLVIDLPAMIRGIVNKGAGLTNADLTTGGGTYDNTTDSLEAATDTSAPAFLMVVPNIPNSIDLAGTATVRLALALSDAIADLPTTAEITPGTVLIARKAPGGTSWTTIRNNVACSEAAGLIYYDEVFSSGNGYSEGDSIQIIFKSQSVVISSVTMEISDGTQGRTFQTYIRTSVIRIKKNTAMASFQFTMCFAGTNVPATGKAAAMTTKVSKDHAAFANLAGGATIATEIGSTGAYWVPLAAADLNFDNGELEFTAVGCDIKRIPIITQL